MVPMTVQPGKEDVGFDADAGTVDEEGPEVTRCEPEKGIDVEATEIGSAWTAVDEEMGAWVGRVEFLLDGPIYAYIRPFIWGKKEG